MAIKVYSSANLIILDRGSSLEKIPKGQIFYRQTGNNVSLRNINNIDINYTDEIFSNYQNQAGTPYASVGDLLTDLDDIINKGGAGGDVNYQGSFTNYTALTTDQPAGNAGYFAFVENSQGTQWLPGSLGGSYYGAGWYYDTGSAWTNKNDAIFNGLQETTLTDRVVVNQSNVSTTLGGTIDSTKQYFIDGSVDMTGVTVTVPSTGLFISGLNLDLSELTCSDNSYTMFTGATAGNVFINNLSIEVSGTSSKVFDLTNAAGTETVELSMVNFNNCTSRGELNGYRQMLETGIGFFGGTPELTFSGTWSGGYRIDTSILRGTSNFTSLYKEGTSFTFNGRFIIEINVDLPATGNLINFQASNVNNDESLIIRGAFVTRSGSINTSDANISPNINEKSVKSLWSNNTGVPNTQKYIRQVITTEVTTTITTAGVYEILAGTWTVDSDPSHFDSPSNGQIRLLSGNGKYQIFGNLTVEGGTNDVVDVRCTRSTDGGSTFPTVINHVRRQINSLVGGRDVAFFDINFLTTLEENDRIRLEVENVTDTTNVTGELDSTLIITAL